MYTAALARKLSNKHTIKMLISLHMDMCLCCSHTNILIRLWCLSYHIDDSEGSGEPVHLQSCQSLPCLHT